MRLNVTSVEQYVDAMPDERKQAISKLRKLIPDHLPQGFVETMSYGMIGYVVPHSIYHWVIIVTQNYPCYL